MRVVEGLCLAASIIFSLGTALAQTVSIDKLSDAELQKLTPDQIKTMPVFELLNRTDPKIAAGLRQWVPLTLRELGYGFREAFTASDDQLQSWVTQFQHDIGEPETGVLTFGEMETLTKREAAVNGTSVSLPIQEKNGPTVSVTKDFASAEGTWIIEDDQIANPLNVTSFRCFRQMGYCFQSDVQISDRYTTGYVVTTYQDVVPITGWNDDEVVANNEAPCATTTTTINAKAKEVFQITRNNGQSRKPLLSPLAKPRISRLVNGFDLAFGYFNKKREEAAGYRSKEYQEYVKAMAGSATSAEKQQAPARAHP